MTGAVNNYYPNVYDDSFINSYLEGRELHLGTEESELRSKSGIQIKCISTMSLQILRTTTLNKWQEDVAIANFSNLACKTELLNRMKLIMKHSPASSDSQTTSIRCNVEMTKRNQEQKQQQPQPN